MIKVNSVTFGEMEFEEKDCFVFEKGIPGLLGIKRYVVIDNPEMAPFKWLQACESPFLSLMTLDPLLLNPNYKVTLTYEHDKYLGGHDLADMQIMSLVVVPDDPRQMTANLLAPIVLNTKTHMGAQIVIDGTKDLLRVKVIKD